MNKLEHVLQNSEQENIESRVLELAERLDFIDVQILRKFYVTGKEFPEDTRPFCFPLLYREMKVSNHLKIGIEALRKRLENLIGIGFLEKVKNSNPTNYMPVDGKENLVRGIIAKFFIIHGITKFL